MCSTYSNSRLLHIHITNQKIHVYNYVDLHIVIFHEHVSVTHVIITRVSSKMNIKLIVKISMIKLLNNTL